MHFQGFASVEMNTELVCVMASLGYGDGEEYYKGVDCLGKVFLSENYH